MPPLPIRPYVEEILKVKGHPSLADLFGTHHDLSNSQLARRLTAYVGIEVTRTQVRRWRPERDQTKELQK